MAEDEVKEVEEVKENSETKRRPVKKRNWVKKILFGIIAFVVIIFGLAFFFTKGASEAADQIIGDLQAGNCTEVYNVTSQGFKDQTSSDVWDENCQRISPILAGEPEKLGVEVSAESGQDSTSNVSYKIKGTDDVTYIVELVMAQEGGQWHLVGLNSQIDTATPQE
jgi:hypothetical protein